MNSCKAEGKMSLKCPHFLLWYQNCFVVNVTLVITSKFFSEISLSATDALKS